MLLREVDSDFIVCNKNVCVDETQARNLEQKYKIQDKRWKRYKSGFVFVYPKTHIFSHEDPRHTLLDPWNRKIRNWKYSADDKSCVWHERIVTNRKHTEMIPENSHIMATNFAYTSICDVWIALFLINQGALNTCKI